MSIFLAGLFSEREGAAFFSSGHKSQGQFFSQEGTNPNELGMFPKKFITVETVQYRTVCTVPAGNIFLGRVIQV